MYDICVFAGRMRPVTGAHIANIRAGLSAAQYTFVVIGSVGEATHFKNPFTFEEVSQMIRASLTVFENDRVFIFGVSDRDSDLAWVRDVQHVVTEQAKRLFPDKEADIALVGCAKDGTSYYLQLFPGWEDVAVEPILNDDGALSATFIRNALYDAEEPGRALEALKDMHGTAYIPQGSYLFLRQWVNTPHFLHMQHEYKFMTHTYLPQFQPNPYTGDPQQFLAADACLMQAGAVLLVQRKEAPGKGLWALPGGHKRAYQTFFEAALDEVGQETMIFDLNPNISREFLALCLRGEKLLDNPWRSNREVTVSYAYGFLLPGTDRPLVEGADDASIARWWNIDEVSRSMMFEDHFNVIEDFSNRFRNITV